MSSGQINDDARSLEALFQNQELFRVAIVDDAFDDIRETGLRQEDADELWSHLEFNEAAPREITDLRLALNTAEDLNGAAISQLLRHESQCPEFMQVWTSSDAQRRMAEGLFPLHALINYLSNHLSVETRPFHSTVEPQNIVSYDPQILFLDWLLGGNPSPETANLVPTQDPPEPVLTAIRQVREMLSAWPSHKPKPLIVLMSSQTHVDQHASDFCRRAEILRGMFYPISKSVLTDSFDLRLHLALFAKSLSSGRQLQSFTDTLRAGFGQTETLFFSRLGDLTLTDYAYIQGLCLQDDGQPLGDYLFWLFGAYLGHLLFGEALETVRANLTAMTFGESLPSLSPPSERLTEIYHAALFDTSVGEITRHPRAASASTSDAPQLPALALGDLLAHQDPQVGANPDLFLVINAQCDLEFTPDSNSRPPDIHQSILLLPGHLKPVTDRSGDKLRPKTELYFKDNKAIGSYGTLRGAGGPSRHVQRLAD